MTTLTRQHQAARVAAEELTGLALQEKALTQLIDRFASEAPAGGPREAAEERLSRSRSHQQTLDRLLEERKSDRGTGELVAGVVRSGMVVAGAAAGTVAQIATAGLAAVRPGGGEERVLEDLGVEVGAWANKLLILSALNQALELAEDAAGAAAIGVVRQESQDTLDELLDEAPEVMTQLVTARAGEPSYDMRTRG